MLFLQDYRILNEGEIVGNIVNDSILDKYDFNQITAKEYFDLLEKESDNDTKIAPLIDLKVKDDKGHLYLCTVSTVYKQLEYNSGPRNGDITGWIVREDFKLEDIKINMVKDD